MRALRARVRALQRTMALELAVVRLRRLSEEFCIESSVVRANGQPAPQPHAFIQRVASAGFRLPSFMAAHQYLERCRTQRHPPRPRRPPSLPRPLVRALSRSRLLAGMKTVAQSSRQVALFGTRRVIAKSLNVPVTIGATLVVTRWPGPGGIRSLFVSAVERIGRAHWCTNRRMCQ